MTSNVGAKLISSSGAGALGFSGDASGELSQDRIRDAVMKELKNAFRPEFLNRVDDIIVFHRLTQENINTIASRMLGGLAKRVESLGITLSFSDEAVKAIAEAGFDPVYGARPLRRAIQSKIEDKLSEEMLEGNVSGGNKYTCVVNDGVFEFKQE